MAKFSSEIVIKKPVDVVFAYVSDVSNNPKWQSVREVLGVKRYRSGKVRAYKETQAYRAKEATSVSRVIANSLNKRFKVRSKLGSYKMTMEYLFTSQDHSTKLLVNGELSGGGLFGKSIWFHVVSPKMLQGQLNKNLNNLKKNLET